MKSEILSMLRVVDGYFSGQRLCDKMGVPRAAVWKATSELKEEGYKVEAVRSRGYHLMENADVIIQIELQSMFRSKWAGDKPEYFDETGSTNTRARKLAKEGVIHDTLIVANSQ